MATWPITLPKPQHGGYSLQPTDQTIRSEMEVGPARVRRRTSARNDVISLTWIMTDAQFLIFRTWFDSPTTGISGGAGWFIGLPIAVGSRVQDTLNCRFVGTFAAALTTSRLLWTITAKVEVQ